MRSARLLAVLAALSLAGCATPGPALTDSVGSIRTGVADVREQSTLAFESANQSALQIEAERVVRAPPPNLSEADFPLAIADADRSRWSNALGVLDDYLAAVQKLVAPERATATATELDAIAGQLRGGATGLELPGAATAAFSTFAGALVQAKAERTATAAMRRVDPAFQEVIAGMGEAIGPDDRSGLRQTVRLFWSGKLATIRGDYDASGTAPAAIERRRAVVNRFVRAMQGRDADMRKLAALRSSLDALGAAHAAAARGSPGDAVFWIGRIGGWLDDIKTRAAAADLAADQAAGQVSATGAS